MSTFQRHSFCLRACLLAAAAVAAGSAAAQTFPSRPVTIIVPYAAGATDQQARQMAEIASRELGQTIVVENREGAGGMIGANFVASSKPDGYTILYGAPAVITVTPLLGNAPYGYDDLKALARANIIPHLLAARADAPFKTVPELVAYAKANPGKVTFGSPGNGTAVHLAGEAFAKAAGIQLSHVPYRGVAPAVTAAAGGFVDLVLGAPGAINPQVENGRLRSLAQLGEARTSELPSVPTAKEQGIDIALGADFGFFVPKGTPEAAMQRLQSALKTAIESDAFRKSVTAALSSPAFLPADEYQKVVDDEYAVYSKVAPTLSLGGK